VATSSSPFQSHSQGDEDIAAPHFLSCGPCHSWFNLKAAVGLSTDFTDGLEQEAPPVRCFHVTRRMKRQPLATGFQSVDPTAFSRRSTRKPRGKDRRPQASQSRPAPNTSPSSASQEWTEELLSLTLAQIHDDALLNHSICQTGRPKTAQGEARGSMCQIRPKPQRDAN
jgi:hypothetical protein